MNRESRGIITAKNPDSSASGKWQILDSTWQLHDSQGNAMPFMGYWHAMDAPEWVQDAKARSMALCNWEPPNYCA
jgi:muramidase (phage lysozyme)